MLTFLLPIAMVTLFTFAFSGNGNSEEDVNVGLIHAVSGNSILMLLFSMSAIGAGILEEKEKGTLKKLLISPLPAFHILYGKMLTGFVVSILQLTILFLFAWLVFGLQILPHITSLLIMIITVGFACTSFGILLASVVKSRAQVQGLSTILILLMSALGGSMIPLFVMPEIMQKMAVVTINYWGIQGFYDIFWKQLPIADILMRAGVLLGIGFVISGVSIYFFNKNVLKLI